MATGSDKRQRSAQILVRLTTEELGILAAKADRAGYTRAAFARAALLGDPGLRARRLPPADHVMLRRVLADLGRVGNNLNQLARGMNMGEVPEVPELRDAARALLQARDAIFEALGKERAGDYQGKEPGWP